MRNYTPDAWRVIRIKNGNEVIDKVLAGWYGGYVPRDSWKINSGIERIVETEKTYEVHGSSGSVYICHKGAERMSGLMASVFASFVRELAQAGLPPIEEVEMRDVLKEYVSES